MLPSLRTTALRSLGSSSVSSCNSRQSLGSSRFSKAAPLKRGGPKPFTQLYQASHPQQAAQQIKRYTTNSNGPAINKFFDHLEKKASESADYSNAYLPKENAEESSGSTVDASLTKTVTTEEVDLNSSDLKATRYRGFGVTDMSPEEVASFEPLERKASETLQKATQARDIHTNRELATRARELYDQYLEATGNHGATSSVLFHLGLACGMLQDHASQVECLFAALEKDEGLIPAKRYLADALQQLGRHPEAIHYYDEYFNDFPRYYARIADDNGSIESGGSTFNLPSEDILADTVFSRGRSYLAMGKYGIDVAKEDFKAVVRLDGKHKANSLYYLGIAEFQGKADMWKAIKYFDLALKTGPAAWYMYKGRSDAWRALGKEDRAEDDERLAHVLRRQKQWDGEVDSTIRTPEPEFDFTPYINPDNISHPGNNTK